MPARARLVAILVAGSALLAPLTVTGHPPLRRHRLMLPAPQLPTALAVDEIEYKLTPSEPVVAAGKVTVHVYNRGQDDHNIVFYDSKGAEHTVYLRPGASGTLSANLAPGHYRFICSLFAGTPQSHELLGMHFELTVK